MNCFEIPTLCIVIFLTLYQQSFSQDCSKVSLPDNCICRPEPPLGVSVTCRGLHDPSEVSNVLKGAPNCVHLTISDSVIPWLPLGIEKHNLINLTIQDTAMPYLSPPTHSRDSAFTALPNLYRIKLANVNDISGWDWSKLQNLTNLKVLHIVEGRIVYLPKEFSKIGSSNMEELILEKCELRIIGKEGLAFPNLKFLQIKDDPLEELNVEMFHNNSKIETLLLYGLPLKRLLPNVFSVLKNLKQFYTDTDVFSALSEEHFNHLKLDQFNIYPGRTITTLCDCKHKWIMAHGTQYIGDCMSESQTIEDFATFLKKC